MRSGALHTHIDSWPAHSLNPDEIVLQLRLSEPYAAELDILREAQDRSDRAVDRAISDGTSFTVETVLSSDKFKARVNRAKSLGFCFEFIFVTVDAVDMNIVRVRDRVIRGGHDVPADRVVARRLRSHLALGWFAHAADMGFLFDNTVAPIVIAEKAEGAPAWTIHHPSLHPDLAGQL